MTRDRAKRLRGLVRALREAPPQPQAEPPAPSETATVESAKPPKDP